MEKKKSCEIKKQNGTVKSVYKIFVWKCHVPGVVSSVVCVQKVKSLLKPTLLLDMWLWWLHISQLLCKHVTGFPVSDGLLGRQNFSLPCIFSVLKDNNDFKDISNSYIYGIATGYAINVSYMWVLPPIKSLLPVICIQYRTILGIHRSCLSCSFETHGISINKVQK